MPIVDYDGAPIGAVGKVVTRWMDMVYVVRLPDGTFRWMNTSELGSVDPNRYKLEVGDIGVVTTEEHQHEYAKLGNLFQIVKVVNDVDYYEVNIDGKIYWLGGFQLATYVPPLAAP